MAKKKTPGTRAANKSVTKGPITRRPPTPAPANDPPATESPHSSAAVDEAARPLPKSYSDVDTYRFLLPLIGILVAIAWIGINASEENRVMEWFLILILMTAFTFVVGRQVTGFWRGILIDARNKISLSRLQMLAWTLVVLSGILTAALTNIAYGWDSPLNIEIPTELWVAMGISTVSLVASPAILSNKATKVAEPDVVENMEAKTDAQPKGLIACNRRTEDARWADLLMGEEVGNYAHVDLGKMQMFLFTFILVLSYGAAIASMLREPGIVTGLPDVAEGMNVLLGISHTGYLSNKTISHTAEAPVEKAA